MLEKRVEKHPGENLMGEQEQREVKDTASETRVSSAREITTPALSLSLSLSF
jgi:hypothetical protein